MSSLHLITLMLMASSATTQQCQQEKETEEEASQTELQPGLTFQWTTPLLRMPMLQPDTPELAQLAANIERRFLAFKRGCTLKRGQTPNDAFFEQQRAAWEAGASQALLDAISPCHADMLTRES